MTTELTTDAPTSAINVHLALRTGQQKGCKSDRLLNNYFLGLRCKMVVTKCLKENLQRIVHQYFYGLDALIHDAHEM